MEAKTFEGKYTLSQRSQNPLLKTLPQCIDVRTKDGIVEIYNSETNTLLFSFSKTMPGAGLQIALELGISQPSIKVTYNSEDSTYIRIENNGTI